MYVSLHQTKWGKGIRKDVYLLSAPYIQKLISVLGLSKDDFLFKSTHKKEGNKHFLNQHANKILQELASKAEIKKPVSMHKLRHALATDMTIRGYPESIICQKFGWVLNSDAATQYKHLDDDDVIDAKLRMTGLSDKAKAEMPAIEIRDAAEVPEIAGTAEIIKKQTVDIEELKKQNEQFKQILQSMADAFGFEMRPDGSFKFDAKLRVQPKTNAATQKKGLVAVITSDELDSNP